MDPDAMQNLQQVQDWPTEMVFLAVLGLAGCLGLIWAASKAFWLIEAILVQAGLGILFAGLLPNGLMDSINKLPGLFGWPLTAVAIGSVIVLAISLKNKERDGVLYSTSTKVIAGLMGGPLLVSATAFHMAVTRDLPTLGLSVLRVAVSILRSVVPQLPDVPMEITG